VVFLVNDNAVRGTTEQRLPFGRRQAGEKGQTAAMTDWWHEIDDAIVNCVLDKDSMTPAEIGRQLGMSTEAVTSLLGRLAQEGKITILRVALATPASAGGGD